MPVSGGLRGEPQGSPVLCPVRQPAQFRHPDWRRGSGNFNRNIGITTMSNTLIAPTFKGDILTIIDRQGKPCTVICLYGLLLQIAIESLNPKIKCYATESEAKHG